MGEVEGGVEGDEEERDGAAKGMLDVEEAGSSEGMAEVEPCDCRCDASGDAGSEDEAMGGAAGRHSVALLEGAASMVAAIKSEDQAVVTSYQVV